MADISSVLLGNSTYGIKDTTARNAIPNIEVDENEQCLEIYAGWPGEPAGSNKIVAMTGYSIAASASAITTSDTLNQAVGKLEKGLSDVNSTIGTINTTLEEVL